MSSPFSAAARASSARLTVEVADMKASSDPEAHLITFALGSCIGVTVYDPIAKVAGLLHFMLPKPTRKESPEAQKQFMYGATGVPLLFQKCYELGAQKSRVIVTAAGAAEVIDDSGTFTIGARNRTMLRKLLWKNNVVLNAEDTGGKSARTMAIDLADGTVTLKVQGQERVLWQP